MNATQTPADATDPRDALCRVALSLDSLLVNGIAFGVLRGDLFPGFLGERASALLGELDVLEEVVRHRAGPVLPAASAALRAAARQLVALLHDLTAFRSLSPESLRAAVSRISPLREECARQLQILEAAVQTPEVPFSRPR